MAVVMTIAGATPSTRVAGISVRDLLNDAPNTCNFTVDATPPTPGNEVKLGIGDVTTPSLIFAGTVESVEQIYELRRENIAWRVSCQDYTALLNRRRPFGAYVNISATTIAEDLIANFTTGFTDTYVEAALPLATITFDGSRDVSACLTQLARLIGGYWYLDYGKSLHFFLEETSDPPDDVDETNPFLNDPAIAMTTDLSQVRTRVYGRGHGEQVLGDVDSSDTLVPIADAVMFNQLGGQAIIGTTPAVAPSQIVSYTGIQLGGTGGLVGPGASPSNAPAVGLAASTGIESGAHSYAATYVTGAGESVASPLASITVGTLAVPATAPQANTISVGSGPDTGSHKYGVTFVTASGETTPNTDFSGGYATTYSETTGGISAPSSAPTATDQHSATSQSSNWRYVVTFVNAAGETTAGPYVQIGGWLDEAPGPYAPNMALTNIPLGPSGTTARRVYRCPVEANNPSGQLKRLTTISNNTATTYTDTTVDSSLGVNVPTSNTTATTTNYNRPILSSIPLGPPVTTARNLYRTVAGGSQLKFLATLADNTTTGYTDSTVDASLGADAPTSNTATANRVSVSSIPIGPAAVTGRKLYRTVAAGSQLKLLTTISDNTTTTYADSTADASLGANVPTSDTSGLSQPTGQVVAGSTTLIVASIGALPTTGWAIIGNGQQAIRYTGVTGSSLTGVPATGAGAITASIGYNSTVTAAPMLTGVTGLAQDVSRGAMAHIWVTRNDAGAQAAMAVLDGGDGIYEHLISDERRGEASLEALCEADLARFGHPIVTVRYATRDTKTRSGKTVHVDMPSLGMSGDFTIQSVTIDQINIAASIGPRYIAEASSIRFSLEDVLRRLSLDVA